MMIIPIPLYRTRAPYVAPRCPHCNKLLPNWEPPSDERWYDTWWWIGGTVLFGIVFVVWGIITLISWIEPITGPKQTLVQTIIDQWHWFVGLLHRIY